MKALKFALYGVAGLVLLALVALAAAAIVVDGAFVKDRLARYLKEEKGRTLKIEGVPKLSIFPVARLELGRTTLSEHGSEQVFFALDSLQVAVRTLPLLSGEVAVDALAVSGLKVDLVRRKDGTLNVDDLAGGHAAAPAAAPARAPSRNVRVAEVKIENAQLSFRDQSSGQEIRVSDLNLTTGRLEEDKPTPLAFSAHVTGKKPDIDLKAQLKANAQFNLAREVFSLADLDARAAGNADTMRGIDLHATGSLSANADRHEYSLNAVALQVKATLERDALTATLAAPKVAIAPGGASGSEVTGAVQIRGAQRNIDAKLRIAAVQGSASALSIPDLALDLDATDAGNSVKGRIATPVKANLAARSVELPKIEANLTFSGPAIPQKTVTLPIQASARCDMAKQTAAVDLSTKFDESAIQAKLAATRLAPLAASFDVNVDRINLDRYFPAKKEASNPNAPVDLSGLKGPNVAGKIAIGALTVRQAKLSAVKADIKLAGGKLEVSPHSANLYGGSVAGSLSADANGNRVAAKETVSSVAVGPLLHDVAAQDRLEGTGNLTLDVAMQGASAAAMKKSMNGTAKLQLKDGAVKGINLAEAFRDIKSVLGSKSAKGDDPSKKTDFSEITASFTIKNGVAHNDDLQGKSPFLRLTGAGDLDVGASTINYTAKAALVATTQGQGGAERGQLSGLTVPVRLTGALEKPSVSIDFGELIGKAGIGKVLEKAGGAVGGAAGGAAGAVKDKLKGLFGR